MPNAVLTDWPSGPANAGWPTEPSAMLEPGKVEGWPAGTQRTTTAAARLLSQAVGYWDARTFRDGDRFLRNQGTGGDLLDMRLGSAAVANSNDPLYLAPDQSGGYVYLPGVSGNRLQIADANDLDLTGDLDIRVRVGMDAWTPAADSILASKFSSPSQRSWFLRLFTTGFLQLSWSNDGSAVLAANSTTAIGLNAGDVRWVRATLDVDNGASGNSVEFFTSLDGTNWTKLGNTVTSAGTTSVFASTADIFVGSASGSEFCAGKFYAFQLRNGINGTTVLDIDCDAITSGAATSFTATTGQAVSINRSSTGRKCVAVPRGGQPVFLFGTDDYLECADNWQHGLLNFQQNDSFTMILVGRMWPTISNFQFLASKAGGTGFPGYSLLTVSNSVYCSVNDGTTEYNTASSVPGYGVGSVGTFLAGLDRTQSVLRAGVGTDVRGVAQSRFGTLRNVGTFQIGRNSGTGTSYADFEFYAAAVFRRALTASEVALLTAAFSYDTA